MRSLRAFLFLCVGLCLGGGSVFAFAAPSDYGRSMRLNAPESSRARFTGRPIYDFDSAPSSWGKMKDINSIGIGNKVFDVAGGRLFSPQTLAKGAVSFVRFGGPAWIGFMLAGLVWDEVSERWLTEEEAGYEGVGYTVRSALGTNGGYAISQSCVNAPRDAAVAAGVPGRSAPTLQEAYDLVYGLMPEAINCLNSGGGVVTMTKQAKSVASSTPIIHYKYASNNWYVSWSYDSAAACPTGQIRSSETGQCVEPGGAEADDQALEDAIYVELVARGMGSDLARRLIEAGYNPPVEGIEIDGPTSIPGDSVTSTTSGPAGITSTTTNTTHNISYTTNTTNNTSTVTITNVATTTTTAPDGTTTTETTETAPEGSTEPPPEEKPFCELYPEASACAKLDVPPVDPNESEDVTVTLTPTGGFGAEGGACPPPYPFVVQGRSYQISYAQACDFFSAVRPVVIAAAMLSALLIALGGYKRD